MSACVYLQGITKVAKIQSVHEDALMKGSAQDKELLANSVIRMNWEIGNLGQVSQGGRRLLASFPQTLDFWAYNNTKNTHFVCCDGGDDKCNYVLGERLLIALSLLRPR
jgi:hypothetical protein